MDLVERHCDHKCKQMMNLQWTNTCFSTRVFHKYTKLPGSKARSVDGFIDPVFYKATKLPDPKSPSIDCVIVLRKLCYAMGKVEVADLQWFPLSQTIDLGERHSDHKCEQVVN
ncbi:hypothetical protein T07_9509 [Trichinella nelsoni]|uniref:Uncharacterized protein n=1 Tax=Trichinella nelsoni TaxID=6336 RepID=A0A0V0RVI7_9BILA|nr:hypothetical protein T07_9509 [Trichinella nelsoni]